MSYTETDVRRLGQKLDAFDLADGEQAALEALVSFAARKPDELAAFAGPESTRFQQVLAGILFES